MVTFVLDPCHDAGALARDFARDGRVTIDGLIDEASAVELYRNLQARDDWRHIVINEDKLVELDRATRAGLTDHQREILDQAVYGGAQSGFQARYDAIRAHGNDVSLGERDPSCAAVAAPVFGPRGILVGVISLSGPRERFGDTRVAEMKSLLGPVAAKLTGNLGGEWPAFTS